MAIKSVQPFGPEVKTVPAFLPLPGRAVSLRQDAEEDDKPRGIVMAKNVQSRTRGLFGRGLLSYSYIKCKLK